MAKKAARKKKPSQSKSDAIRSYKNKHPEVGPKAIAEALNKQGYDVSAQFVSTVLSNDRRKVGLTRSGSAGRGKLSAVKSSARPTGKLTVDDLIVAKTFVDQMGGVEAAKAAVDTLAQLSSGK